MGLIEMEKIKYLTKTNILSKEEVLVKGVNVEDLANHSDPMLYQLYTKPMEDGGIPFDGFVYELFPNGKLGCYGSYKNGMEYGTSVDFYPSGVIKKIYEQMIGIRYYIEYHENSKIKEIGWIEFGHRIKTEEYDENSNLICETSATKQEIEFCKWHEARYCENEERQLLIKEVKTKFIQDIVQKIKNTDNDNNAIHEKISSLKEDILIEIQNDIKKSISFKNKVKNIKAIAGVDLAYLEIDNKEYAVCIIAIIDYITGDLLGFVHDISEINKHNILSEVKKKYVPGFLAFREIPGFLKAFNKIKTELNIEPDVYMFDGNGYLHPRNMGLATYAGIVIDKPTFGVAKSYLKINNTDFIMPENFDGATTNIFIKDEIYGVAYRSHKDVKPVFISTGNYIDLETATNITKQMITKASRIPLPTRYADLLANDLKRKIVEKSR